MIAKALSAVLASTGIVGKRPLRHCRTRSRGVREPDVPMERRQPAFHRLARPANLLKVRRHLVIAQARVIAASRADNLIPARVAAISMAVDHTDRLCPEKSGAAIVPGDFMTYRHAAIVHREPNAPGKETIELQVANWLHRIDCPQRVPEHAWQVHSAITEPYMRSWPELVSLPRMQTSLTLKQLIRPSEPTPFEEPMTEAAVLDDLAGGEPLALPDGYELPGACRQA